jgi:hypothetical protein
MELVNKLEKFIDGAESFLRTINCLPDFDINTKAGRIVFKGEAVDVIVTRSPISVIVSLRGGSVGLISTVICSFATVFGKPFMIYMVRDSSGYSDVTAHFLTSNIDANIARATILLAEFLAEAKDIVEIDFSEVEKEAERYLSQYF